MSKSFWLLSAGLTALATPAYAQNANATAPAGQPSGTQAAAAQADSGQPDIIVTAQGRRQLLQDVPLAVQAVGGEQLQNSGANDIRQLNQLAPSLLVSSTGTEANGSARIRGIGTVGDNPGLESSVAVFIDGVYRSRSASASTSSARSSGSRCCAARRAPCSAATPRPASSTSSPAGRNSHFGGYAELTYGNYNDIRGAGRHHRPAQRRSSPAGSTRSTSRRDGFYHVVNPTGGTEARRQRPQPLLRARPIAVRAERPALGPPDRRLYAPRRILLRRRLSRPHATNPLIGASTIAVRRSATSARQRQQHHQRAARSRPAARRLQQPLQPQHLRSARAAPTRASPRTGACPARSTRTSAAARS